MRAANFLAAVAAAAIAVAGCSSGGHNATPPTPTTDSSTTTTSSDAPATTTTDPSIGSLVTYTGHGWSTTVPSTWTTAPPKDASTEVEFTAPNGSIFDVDKPTPSTVPDPLRIAEQEATDLPTNSPYVVNLQATASVLGGFPDVYFGAKSSTGRQMFQMIAYQRQSQQIFTMLYFTKSQTPATAEDNVALKAIQQGWQWQ